MSSPIAILSPHLDDAVLSCWDVLTGEADVRVINVFAGVPPAGAATGWWDALSGDGDPRATVRRRIAEDRSALALAGREPLNLDFLDRQYRSGAPGVDEIVDAVRALLPARAVVLGPAAVAPQPDIGQEDPGLPHPDHVAVRQAALALRDAGFEVALYADLPHASGRLAEVGATASVADVRLLSPAAFARKVEAVRRYASQVPVLERAFNRRVEDPGVLDREVVWQLPAP